MWADVVVVQYVEMIGFVVGTANSTTRLGVDRQAQKTHCTESVLCAAQTVGKWVCHGL